MVQHGVGAPQAVDIYREQLALLPWLWASVGCAYADTAVLYYKVILLFLL